MCVCVQASFDCCLAAVKIHQSKAWESALASCFSKDLHKFIAEKVVLSEHRTLILATVPTESPCVHIKVMVHLTLPKGLKS